MIPEGIVDSLWYDVVERCEEFGDTFDAWQDGLGEAILGIRDDGMFAATVGGLTLSIPRQVAKTFIVGRICVALCTLFPNLTILWTAHRTRTTTRTFQSLKGVVTRPSVIGYLRAGGNNGTAIRDTNGEQAIPFANGSEILFGAREGGFGRGFEEVDVEVFDEAQILTVKALEDMVAATNQSRFEHGALLFYMGTPPRPTDPGEAFTERRAEALTAKRDAGGTDFGPAIEHGDTLFVECSADANVGQPDGPSLDDPRQVEKANPSYPHRTPPVAVKRLRKNLPGDDAWRREGLGVWDDIVTSSVIDRAAWNDGRGSYGTVAGPFVLSVETTLDRSQSVLVAVGTAGERAAVRVLKSAAGTAWVAPTVARVMRERDVAAIVLDDRGQAAPLAQPLQDAIDAARVNTELVVTKASDVAEACALVLDAIRDRAVVHGADPELEAAVRSAAKRDIGDGAWAWSRRKGGPAVGALVAFTLAHWHWRALSLNDYDPMDSFA